MRRLIADLAICSLILTIKCEFYRIDLPEEHLPLYFNQFPNIKEQCRNNPACPYSNHLNSSKCWGYESKCERHQQYSIPVCSEVSPGWAKTKFEQEQAFYKEGDFGYVRQQISELKVICEPRRLTDSSLLCSDHLRFCVGRNLKLNFSQLAGRREAIRYKMDVLGDGDIGGHCKLNKDKLKTEADHVSPLQSWAPELRFFKELKQPALEKGCDVIVDKPTFIMKIDATVNMYHHFCDFFNLYASLHVNSTHPHTFTRDTQILVWESFTYHSAFSQAFEAFTTSPVWDLKHVAGKIVCFKNVVFPLLPRMIFGLYYNTPLIPGCEKSGLFHAFSKHILHRLQIKRKKRTTKKVNVTFLSRKTKYRNVLNEEELLNALKKNKKLSVKRVVYDKEFKKQLEQTANSDVFIGMHGAGLTHLLFLPDWAVIFELHHCDDPQCYLNLARLRGIKYMTWQNTSLLYQQDEGHHPDGGAHAKFTNYAFDVNEFTRLVAEAADYVRNHDLFKQFTDQYSHDEL